LKDLKMLLAVDIGNTNITLGIFDGDSLLQSWRLTSEKNKTEDEYGIILNKLLSFHGFKNIDSAVISGVVFPLTEVFKKAVEKYINIPVLLITPDMKLGISLDIENPSEVGADRIANAAAVSKLYKLPAVVVDFGTATTFDIVDKNGNFTGGIIAPGIKISAEALNMFTSLLPKIRIESSKSVIGKNTVQSILSGIIRGHAAMIEGLISEIEQELGSPVKTIATGGYSELISKYLKRPFDDINPDLTLHGLKMIYELNKSVVLSTHLHSGL